MKREVVGWCPITHCDIRFAECCAGLFHAYESRAHGMVEEIGRAV